MEAERERRVQTICLLFLAVVASGAALQWLRPVMIPFVLALFIALGLAPLVNLLHGRLRLHRGLAVAVILVLGGIGLVALGSLVSVSVAQLAASRDVYQAQATALTFKVVHAIPFEALGVDPVSVTSRLREASMGTVGRLLLGTTNAVLEILSQSFVVLIFVTFLLAGGLGAESDRPDDTWDEAMGNVGRYIGTQAALSAATGLAVGLILAVLGIDLALAFGLFAFLLNFIPNIGSVIATLLPVPVALMSPDVSTTAAALAIVLPGVVQFVLGNVVAPRVMGRSLDLHPVTILLSLIFWGMLWGMVGMLLAAPVTAVARLVLEKSELTRPIAELLAGRTAALRGR